MDTASYRKNVFKTLSIKPAKDGLKYAARNTGRTNILHGAVGLATEALELLETMNEYLLTGKFSDEAKTKAMDELGDCGYYLVVLAKTVKVKVPGSGKKIKLVGTRGKALLDFMAVAEHLLSLQKKVFYGYLCKPMADTDAGKSVIDVEGQKAADAQRMADMGPLVVQGLDLFFRLSYDMFGVAPDQVFDQNIAKLSHRYGQGFFDQAKATTEKDKQAEAASAKKLAALALATAALKTKASKVAKPKAVKA